MRIGRFYKPGNKRPSFCLSEVGSNDVDCAVVVVVEEEVVAVDADVAKGVDELWALFFCCWKSMACLLWHCQMF